MPKTRQVLLLVVMLLGAVLPLHAEREFRVYIPLEPSADGPLPPDWDQPADFVVARMMFPNNPYFGFSRSRNWREGGTAWAVDYPSGDRRLAQILRRMTRIDVRSVEQPVNLEDGDDVYDWPFMIVGLPGMWELEDSHVAKLREYLLRGGFLLCDSFFGTREWEGFLEGIKRVFPDRPIIELPADHAMFHTVFDIDNRLQVPNWNALRGGVPYRADGVTPHWRAILDDDGRVMVAIAFNNDLGDSYQWADDPGYPAEGANLGLRMGVNFVVYALTH